jgi:hypothetical protein
MAVATWTGSMVKSSPTSTNRTVAPAWRTALSVATNVNGEVITSSPGPMALLISPAISALVPLFTAMA